MSLTASSPSKETPLGDDHHRGLNHFLRLIKLFPRIPTSELPVVYEQLRTGSTDAKERLILSSILFAFKLSLSFSRQYHMPIEDLFQEALIGLTKATDKWDIDRGGFLICAKQWIQNHLHLAVAKYFRHSTQLVSIEEPVQHDSTEKDASTIRDMLEAPDTTSHTDAVMTAHALLKELDPRSRSIIVMRYGLHGEDPMTGAEVGKVLGITRQRISILEQDALKIMRRKAMQRRRPTRHPSLTPSPTPTFVQAA